MMAYLLQIACVALLAEVLLRVVPVPSAGFRYAYWRLVLVAALVMPWLLRATPDDAMGTAVVTAGPAAIAFTQATQVATALTERGTAWLPPLTWLLAGGAALRLLWVMTGMARLRALRRQGVPIEDGTYDEMQQRLGTRADLRAVAGLPQPVTFGLRRPVVLLPESLEASAESIRRAAVTHELVHVQRRDWLFVIVEEALRAIFWFHPAIWWITARIRLTREEFTDHLAVLASGSRRSYMEALLAFADAGRVGPAPAFISRAHLFHRIVLLSKESAMSSRRIVVSGMMLAALLATGGWYASEAFPVMAGGSLATPGMAAPAPQQGTASAVAVNPITPENPIPRRLFATPIPYPLDLAGTGFEAALSVRVVLNASGLVESANAGARAVAPTGNRQPAITEQQAMERFAAAAVDAVSRWQYDPPARAPIAFYLAVEFKSGAQATVSQSEQPLGVHAGPGGARMATPAELAALQTRAASARESQLQREAAAVRGGGAGAAPQAPGTRGGGGRGAAASGGGSQPAAPGTRQETTLTVRPDGAPIRVGGNVRPPNQLRKVAPVYPEEARAAGVEGVVILETAIDEQGRVSSVRVLRSIPLLDQAAVDAVRQWEYLPTLLNGVPVPVIMTTTVEFKLAQ
jgi:TonB family protein